MHIFVLSSFFKPRILCKRVSANLQCEYFLQFVEEGQCHGDERNAQLEASKRLFQAFLTDESEARGGGSEG